MAKRIEQNERAKHDYIFFLEETEIQAARTHVTDLANVTGVDQLFDLPDRGGVQEGVANHER